MQTRNLFLTALVLGTAVCSSACGQDRNAKGGDPFATLLPYVHHDFCAAVVIHPARIARSPLGKSIDLNGLMAAALRDEQLDPTRAMRFVDPAKIDRLTVLLEPFPGGNVGFFPALVLEYAENTPGREVMGALFPDSRPSSDDERLYEGLDSMAGTPINGYVAGPKTILIGPEPTLNKMLSKYRSPRNPLRIRLDAGSADSEVVVHYASMPALESLLKLTGMTEAQFRADPETDEAVKMMLLDVNFVSLDLQIRQTPTIRGSIHCDSLESAANIKNVLAAGMQMMATSDNQEMFSELPAPLREAASRALKDFVRATKAEQKRTTIEVKTEIPATALDFARRSAAELVGEAHKIASRPWLGAEEFEWKRKEPPLTIIPRDKGFAMLTGVQGRLARGSEISIIPNPDGDWTLSGTDHADLAGRAVAVPWFVEAEQPVKFELWKKGELGFPKLIHQSDGFCALLKIGGAFNGGGEQFRLRVGDDGYWRLNARSRAPGTRVRVMVVRLKKPGSFRGVVREHHWENGQQPVRLIHRNEGIAFLSGLAGGFQGGGEFARVRLDKDGYWYLEGRSKQGFLHAWATSIELPAPEVPPSTPFGEAALRVEPETTRLRVWTSADGNFQTTAALVRVVGEAAVLKRDNGRVIEVPLNRLSRSDRDYIASVDSSGGLWVADEATSFRFAIPAGSTSPYALDDEFAPLKPNDDGTIVAGDQMRARTPTGIQLMFQRKAAEEPMKTEAEARALLPTMSETIRIGAIAAQETQERKVVRQAGGHGVQFLYKSNWNPLDTSEDDGDYRVVVRTVQVGETNYMFTLAARSEKFSMETVESILDSLSVENGAPLSTP